jgi:hypothetical protein
MAHPMSITIAELKSRVDAYAADCFDNLTQQKGLSFGPNHQMNFVGGEDNLFGKAAGMTGRLTPWAFSQIAGRLDAPGVRWLDDDKHCPDDLRQTIMNQLVGLREDNRLMVRSKGEAVRAVLSDEYTPFDNKDLVGMVEEAVQTLGVAPEVHRTETGDSMRTYILLPQVTFAQDPTKPIRTSQGGNGQLPGTFRQANANSQYGDGGLHPAVYISNSEIGGGSARITGAVYRYVCGNGLIWGWNTNDIFSIRHRWISMGAMRTLVGEAMGVAFKMSEKAALAFMASQEIHLQPKSLKPMLDDWATKYGIAVDAKENWLAVVTSQAQEYGRAQDPRLFDMINAATYVAQNRGSEEREMMERMAGDLLMANIRTE